MAGDSLFNRVIELADASVQRFEPDKLKWMWGEALYTYALHLLHAGAGQRLSDQALSQKYDGIKNITRAVPNEIT